MIPTRFFLSVTLVGVSRTAYLTTQTNMPFRLMVGEDLVLDDSCDWTVKVEISRYNLEANCLDIYLNEPDLEKEDFDAICKDLHKLGWVNQ